jgi:hypothetical protein
VSDELPTDKVLVTVQVVDIAATARALGMDVSAFTGRPAPEHDYRFSMATPTGGEVTFNRFATAEQVAQYCEREGWLPCEQ